MSGSIAAVAKLCRLLKGGHLLVMPENFRAGPLFAAIAAAAGEQGCKAHMESVAGVLVTELRPVVGGVSLFELEAMTGQRYVPLDPAAAPQSNAKVIPFPRRSTAPL